MALGIEPGYAGFYSYVCNYWRYDNQPVIPPGPCYESRSNGFTLGLGMHLQRPHWFFQLGLPLALVLGGDAADAYHHFGLLQFTTLQLGGGANFTAGRWSFEPRAQLLVMPRVDFYDNDTKMWEILYQSTLTLQARWRALVLVAGGGSLGDAAGAVGGLGFRVRRFQMLATTRRDWGSYHGLALDLALSFDITPRSARRTLPEVPASSSSPDSNGNTTH